MTGEEGLRVDRSRKTLRELVLEKMRDGILNFQFRPGERLVERTLCDRLGVSRTVVREVLRHLETEGLVETIPHYGPVVARPDPTKAAQIYEIRGLLEAEAARVCAERAKPEDVATLRSAIDRNESAFARGDTREVLKGTTEFYEALFSCAGKDVAWEAVKGLNARINQLRSMTVSTPGRGPIAIKEMRRILTAIEAGNGKAAHAASLAHIAAVAALAQTALAQAALAETQRSEP